QNLVRYQRTRGNCRGGDKKGFSDRGGYGCRYRAGHHRDHQCLVATLRLSRKSFSETKSSDALKQPHAVLVLSAWRGSNKKKKNFIAFLDVRCVPNANK